MTSCNFAPNNSQQNILFTIKSNPFCYTYLPTYPSLTPTAVPFQLLRQLLDDKVLCTLQKPFEWKTVEDFSVISAMSMSEFPSANNQMLSSRLLVRHGGTVV